MSENVVHVSGVKDGVEFDIPADELILKYPNGHMVTIHCSSLTPDGFLAIRSAPEQDGQPIALTIRPGAVNLAFLAVDRLAI